MEIDDLDGHTTVTTLAELDDRLRKVRKGDYGAFVLCHDPKGPSLWVHIFKRIAYLHYFPDAEGNHAGFQSNGMSPAKCPEDVRFLQTNGTLADSIIMPRETLVTLSAAYRAAREFYRSQARPCSITWFEL